jgi:hypothetical protein
MTNNTERKDFEASMIQLFGYEADEFYFTDGEYIDPDLNDLYLTWQAALAQREQVDFATLGYVSVIEVEKLLCEKLGIQWTAAGISIESLVERLYAAPAPSLCTAEEAAELAKGLRMISIEGELHGTLVLSTEQLAAFLNADRAKR